MLRWEVVRFGEGERERFVEIVETDEDEYEEMDRERLRDGAVMSFSSLARFLPRSSALLASN